MSEKYVKPHHHYADLYDRHTVEHCRDIEKRWDTKDIDVYEGKKVTKKMRDEARALGKKWQLYIVTGERYLKRSETIREWIDADQKKDDLYEHAQPPEDIRCLTCRNRLTVSSKDLWTGMGKEDRVLFMFDCPNKCLPHRAFFSDGEEWRVKPNPCPQCGTTLKSTVQDDGKKMITTYTCPKCAYTTTDEYEWMHKKEEALDEHFAEDRDRFCLTEEQGKKYQERKWNMEQIGKLAEEWKEKEEARAKKLEENPKGFHLEDGYSCTICGHGTPEGDNWYDKWGIKCLVCQNAIDKGEVPASIAKNKDSWYSMYDLERAFCLKSPTIRKWVRDGILKDRTISRYGNGVHYQLFLIKDNKDFLPPKKLVASRPVTEEADGKVWHTSHPWYQCVKDPFEYLKDYGIMKYMRIVPPEEVKAREEAKAKKREEKLARRMARKKKRT